MKLDVLFMADIGPYAISIAALAIAVAAIIGVTA